MHGEGEMTYEDGRSYKGSYEFDKKHGYGIYCWENKTYEGYWANG